MPDSHSQPSHDDIEVCAYSIWVFEGKPEGRALDHWLQAEMQIAAARQHEQATAEAPKEQFGEGGGNQSDS
jgi:hypothetical protein